MPHSKALIAEMLREVDFGASVAELDDLLETARVETSVFSDMVNDRVDLIPGTKGSGKSALYRIVVEFLAEHLLSARKVVVAHGVRAEGDNVFHAFRDQFDKLSEDDFVNFWCVYLVSLAHENFIKSIRFTKELAQATDEVDAFRRSCMAARIPEIRNRKTLRDVLAWALDAIPRPRKVRYDMADGSVEMDLFGDTLTRSSGTDNENAIPRYINQVKDDLVAILDKTNLFLWLMVDRLDEIFPRRSDTETWALRGLLRTLKIFVSPRIRVKVFLRILEQITSTGEGFTALTHVTARQADSLRWSEDQILTLIVNRLYASHRLRDLLAIDAEKLRASREYRQEAFYKVFPASVHGGSRQSPTLRWIYNHTKDGRGVVTPRDVIELLTRAKQHQQDECDADRDGQAEHIIGASSIQYGLTELSKKKRDTFLKAEFPHFWQHIEKLEGGKTEYNERALSKIWGRHWHQVLDDLTGIGLFEESRRSKGTTWKVPFLYREGLSLVQGLAD